MRGLNSSSLRQFGAEANRLELPRIAYGGLLLPGKDPDVNQLPGKEKTSDGERAQTGQEAGSATGPREGSSAETSTSGTPAYSVESLTAEDVLAELRDFGANTRLTRSSAKFTNVLLSVGLFEDLPYRAELLLEVPTATGAELRRAQSSWHPIIPDVRGWARWTRGVKTGELITTHHQYPDLAICACMPVQWRLGTHPLIWYADFCVVWIAKALHELLFGFYPGLQHYGEKARVERDRRDEYCGCGQPLPYKNCHREADIALGEWKRNRLHASSIETYLNELGRQDRAPHPPELFRNRTLETA